MSERIAWSGSGDALTLKVPQKQKPRGRLWLNDGSCVRLRPTHPNHVWSYDFVSAKTYDGRTVRMLNLIDEHSRECLGPPLFLRPLRASYNSTMSSARHLVLLLAIGIPALQGCDSAAVPCVQQPSASQVATLQRQKDDTVYEMQLRQNELDQMMARVKGAIGVSNQWLQRKSELTEKITQLQVKGHDLDLQIAAASKTGQ
jgi:hypothetical protein